MKIKGLDQIREHIPDFFTPSGVLRYLLLPILVFLLVTTLFNSARLRSPLWEAAVMLALGSLGFGLLYLLIRNKDAYRARFGRLAYSKAASRFGFTGVAIIAAVVARIRYISGPELPRGVWSPLLPVLGWALIAAGVLLFLRVLQTFGLDNLIMLYVYFLEESRLVDHRIYTTLRHPAYSAAQQIAYGLALLNGSWIALACALFFTLGLWGWVSLVEEQELIERFGLAYAEYRRRVPAFLPRPRNLAVFFKFLLFGG